MTHSDQASTHPAQDALPARAGRLVDALISADVVLARDRTPAYHEIAITLGREGEQDNYAESPELRAAAREARSRFTGRLKDAADSLAILTRHVRAIGLSAGGLGYGHAPAPWVVQGDDPESVKLLRDLLAAAAAVTGPRDGSRPVVAGAGPTLRDAIRALRTAVWAYYPNLPATVEISLDLASGPDVEVRRFYCAEAVIRQGRGGAKTVPGICGGALPCPDHPREPGVWRPAAVIERKPPGVPAPDGGST